MRYGLCKKLVFLLTEYYYDSENSMLEDDLCDVINKLSKRDYYALRIHFDECLEALQSIKPKYNEKPYSWVKNEEDLIKHIEYLPVEIGENQCERAIARSEALGDYIYENGYDYFMTHGY